ncbi:MAG TPA: PepSY domain-containing protein [Terriglobia bacterium]
MNLKQLNQRVFITAMALAIGAGQALAQTPAPRRLAKARLSEATAAAKKWRADATLIQIAGSRVADDGTQSLWKYGFFSTSAKTCLIVQLAATTRTTETGGPLCASPALGNFIDSDKAIQIARKHGLQRPNVTMVVSMVPGRRGPRPVWIVMEGGGMRAGDVSVDIDAETGEVLNTSIL